MKSNISIAHSIYFNLYFLSFLFIYSCNKIDVSPPVTSVTDGNAFSSDVTASAILTGIYAKMSSTTYQSAGITSISQFCGLSADEFQLWNGISANPNGLRRIAYYKNSLVVTGNMNKFGPEIWNSAYHLILIANNAVEGLTKSSSLSEGVKQHLIGEAKFIRAFLYFYLVNLYGNIPLVLGTDYKENATIRQSDKNQVYDQIVDDLISSETLLSTDFLDGSIIRKTKERVRPTKWAAKALLARVYLYMEKYSQAEEKSSELINNQQLFGLLDVDAVFLKNSRESIWQLQPVNTGWNTEDARLFIIPAVGFTNNNPISLNDDLVKSFEENDIRRKTWVDSIFINGSHYYYVTKYKALALPITTPPTLAKEYLTVFRIAEQYLIRSEARAQLSNISGSQEDLNAIRIRAGLSPILASTKDDLVEAAKRERRVELFSEWGHRWLDLKRLNIIDDVMTTAIVKKGGTWESFKQLYPIGDVPTNPALIQNQGY